MNRFADIATRQENAYQRLVSAIAERGFDDNIATKIADLYLKEKLAKLDVGVGQFTLKHGVFFEDDVLANAAEAVTA